MNTTPVQIPTLEPLQPSTLNVKPKDRSTFLEPLRSCAIRHKWKSVQPLRRFGWVSSGPFAGVHAVLGTLCEHPCICRRSLRTSENFSPLDCAEILSFRAVASYLAISALRPCSALEILQAWRRRHRWCSAAAIFWFGTVECYCSASSLDCALKRRSCGLASSYVAVRSCATACSTKSFLRASSMTSAAASLLHLHLSPLNHLQQDHLQKLSMRPQSLQRHAP